MKQMFLALVVLASALCSTAVQAEPTFREQLRDVYLKDALGYAQQAQEIQAKLEGMDADLWQPADLQLYLLNALSAVNYAATAYEWEHTAMPDRFEDLGEYLGYWPENIFAGGPMRVLKVEDGFLPGDLVLQLPPKEYWSLLDRLKPLSWEISVYGPTVEFAELGNARRMQRNVWAVVPEGAVYQQGLYTEHEAITLEKRARRAKAKADKGGGKQ